MKIIIYGKSNCLACVEAEVLCKTKGLLFSSKKLGVNYDMIDLFEKVGKDIKSVPQIFVDRGSIIREGEEYIGGLLEFKEFLKGI